MDLGKLRKVAGVMQQRSLQNLGGEISLWSFVGEVWHVFCSEGKGLVI